MTIFATPFNAIDLKTTNESTDSGFQSLTHVVELMGDDYVRKSHRLIIYGDDKNRIAYSDFIFRIDGVGNTG